MSIYPFFPRFSFWILLLPLSLSCKGQVNTISTQTITKERIGGPCECCEGFYEGLPSELSWQTMLINEKEPGERMQLGGKVYKKDGRTPASNVILYVYHTDARGYYSDANGKVSHVTNHTPCAIRHGHLRGWMKTNIQGQYLFQTIRPAAYPNRDEPAHIHIMVKEDGFNEYYLSDFLFSDDLLLKKEINKQIRPMGGWGIITLTRGEDNSWIGKRDIILGLHISNYPR